MKKIAENTGSTLPLIEWWSLLICNLCQHKNIIRKMSLSFPQSISDKSCYLQCVLAHTTTTIIHCFTCSVIMIYLSDQVSANLESNSPSNVKCTILLEKMVGLTVSVNSLSQWLVLWPILQTNGHCPLLLLPLAGLNRLDACLQAIRPN